MPINNVTRLKIGVVVAAACKAVALQMHTIDALCLPLALLLLTQLGCALWQATSACQVENQEWLGDGW